MCFDANLGHSRRSSFDFAQDERLSKAPERLILSEVEGRVGPCTKSTMQGAPAGGTCRLPNQ